MFFVATESCFLWLSLARPFVSIARRYGGTSCQISVSSVHRSAGGWSSWSSRRTIAFPRGSGIAMRYCYVVLLRCNATLDCYVVLPRCTATLYYYVVLLHCTATLYCYVVLLRCTTTLYCYIVLLHCTATLYCYVVLLHCIATLYCYVVLLRCTTTCTVMWYCYVVLLHGICCVILLHSFCSFCSPRSLFLPAFFHHIVASPPVSSCPHIRA